MTEKIKRLEKIAMQLEPNGQDRKLLLDKIINYTENFLTNVNELPAYSITEDRGSGLYDSPVGDEPIDIEEALNLFISNVEKQGINAASGGHLGYIPGGGIYASALGDYMAAVTNRYAGVYFACPGAVRMENMMISWMAQMIGYPDSSGGNLTSGGSIANLTGVVTARDAHGLKAKNFDKTVVYMTEQVHHSVDKALRIAGLGECVQRYITLDEFFRMRPEALEHAIIEDRKNGLNPWLIVASAGTTDVGAVDPVKEIAVVAERYNLWLHVDAAYGGFFKLCESGEKILSGLELSDSIIMDPHKGLFIPYGSGAVLVKDKMKLLESHHYEANYMQDALKGKDELAPADLSVELSKHFRGLRLWLPLKILGLKPFRAALEEKIQLARYFYERIGMIKGFQRGPFPDLSVVTYRYIPENGDANEFNKKLVDAVQKDGRVFISSTMLNGNFTLRLAVLSFRTHLATIDKLLEILEEKVKLLLD